PPDESHAISWIGNHASEHAKIPESLRHRSAEHLCVSLEFSFPGALRADSAPWDGIYLGCNIRGKRGRDRQFQLRFGRLLFPAGAFPGRTHNAGRRRVAGGCRYPGRPDECISDKTDQLSRLSVRAVRQQSVALLARNPSRCSDPFCDLPSLSDLASFLDSLAVVGRKRRICCIDSVFHLLLRGSVRVLDARNIDRRFYRIFL